MISLICYHCPLSLSFVVFVFTFVFFSQLALFSLRHGLISHVINWFSSMVCSVLFCSFILVSICCAIKINHFHTFSLSLFPLYSILFLSWILKLAAILFIYSYCSLIICFCFPPFCKNLLEQIITKGRGERKTTKYSSTHLIIY